MRWDFGSKDAEAYYDATELRGPNPFVEVLAQFLPPGGTALDLGCGIGTTAEWLRGRGFEVDAVDRDPIALARCQDRLARDKGTRVIEATFCDAPAGPYDLVVALFSLFFDDSRPLRESWDDVACRVREGGLFGGQFIGANDDWALGGLPSTTSAELQQWLAGWDVLHFDEAERDGETILGRPKHWHVFHVVARKPL